MYGYTREKNHMNVKYVKGGSIMLAFLRLIYGNIWLISSKNDTTQIFITVFIAFAELIREKSHFSA